MAKGTVWVVGGSTGLGLATAQAFAADGWTVIVGARSFGQTSARAPNDGMHRLALDVTDGESRERFAAEAMRISERIDVLVYCAAVLVLGSCEETSYDEYDRVMRTNFLGMTSMVSTVLPVMRRQNSGKIILFSSINGLLGIPFQGAYTASKHAVEGYAECLAMETRPFGVRVCLVEPGDHRGGSQKCRLHAALTSGNSPYEAAASIGTSIIHRDESKGLPPEKLGQKVVRNANRKHMRFRLRVAKPDQRLAVVLHDVLAPSLNARILRSYYGQKGR